MIWIPLALIAALSSASNDALSKRFFSHLSPYEMGLIRLMYAFPYLFIGLFSPIFDILLCTRLRPY